MSGSRPSRSAAGSVPGSGRSGSRARALVPQVAEQDFASRAGSGSHQRTNGRSASSNGRTAPAGRRPPAPHSSIRSLQTCGSPGRAGRQSGPRHRPSSPARSFAAARSPGKGSGHLVQYAFQSGKIRVAAHHDQVREHDPRHVGIIEVRPPHRARPRVPRAGSARLRWHVGSRQRRGRSRRRRRWIRTCLGDPRR